jgi:hypothetical protein
VEDCSSAGRSHTVRLLAVENSRQRDRRPRDDQKGYRDQRGLPRAPGAPKQDKRRPAVGNAPWVNSSFGTRRPANLYYFAANPPTVGRGNPGHGQHQPIADRGSAALPAFGVCALCFYPFAASTGPVWQPARRRGFCQKGDHDR